MKGEIMSEKHFVLTSAQNQLLRRILLLFSFHLLFADCGGVDKETQRRRKAQLEYNQKYEIESRVVTRIKKE